VLHDKQTVALHKSGNKLYQIGNQVELQKRLLALCKILGVKNPPTPEELEAMAMFLLNEFKDFSYDEIGKAFSMASARKLQVDAEDYNSFDIPYVGRILAAYREYRIKEIQAAKSNEEIPEKTVTLTPEQHFNWVKEYTIEQRQSPFIADWGSVFTHLENVHKGPNGKEMETFKNEMEHSLRAMGKKNLIGFDVMLGKKQITTLNTPELFEAYCKEQWVRKFMNQFVNERDQI